MMDERRTFAHRRTWALLGLLAGCGARDGAPPAIADAPPEATADGRRDDDGADGGLAFSDARTGPSDGAVPGRVASPPEGELLLRKVSGAPAGGQAVWWGDGLVVASGSRLVHWTPPDKTETLATVPGLFGVASAPDGTLIAVAKTVGNSTSGRVVRVAADGSTTLLFEGAGYPQHVAVHRSGRIYWTSFPEDAVMSVAPGQPPKKMSPGVAHSYGIALAPGHDRLYVSSKAPGDFSVYVYPLADDGVQAGARTRLMKTSGLSTPGGLPLQPVINRLQGLCVDVAGNVYFTGAESTNEGLAAVTPDGQRVIAVFRGHRNAVDCTFGGPGMRTLFAIGGNGVTSIDLTAEGLAQ
jgi:sugar lactone lactonase YvrE